MKLALCHSMQFAEKAKEVQPIYLLHPIPEIPYYDTEIKAMNPIVLNGELSNLFSTA